MPDTLTLLIAAAVLFAYIAGAAGPRWLVWKPRKRSVRRAGFKAAPRHVRLAAVNSTHAVDQLRLVMEASFEARKLMSRDEARIFYRIEQTIKACALPWRVMAQVNLGEILKSSSPKAHSAINSKRVDMLIITNGGDPVAAVKYQGFGHYLGTAAARDAVKKEALRRAGIHYVEITPSHSAEDIAREVQRIAQNGVLLAG